MSGDLVLSKGGFPKRVRLHEINDALYGAILTIEDPSFRMSAPVFSDAVRELARDHLRDLAPYLAPASAKLVNAWVQPVIVSVINQRTPEQVAGWFEAVMLAMAGVPCGAFTDDNQRIALRTLTFFPTPADLWNIITSDARDLTRRQATLRQILGEVPNQ